MDSDIRAIAALSKLNSTKGRIQSMNLTGTRKPAVLNRSSSMSVDPSRLSESKSSPVEISEVNSKKNDLKLAKATMAVGESFKFSENFKFVPAETQNSLEFSKAMNILRDLHTFPTRPNI